MHTDMSMDIIEFLLRHGADVNARNHLGFTPIEWAKPGLTGALQVIFGGFDGVTYLAITPSGDPQTLVGLIWDRWATIDANDAAEIGRPDTRDIQAELVLDHDGDRRILPEGNSSSGRPSNGAAAALMAENGDGSRRRSAHMTWIMFEDRLRRSVVRLRFRPAAREPRDRGGRS
jgi:hypothetical protein